jgi:hypothetical protein
MKRFDLLNLYEVLLSKGLLVLPYLIFYEEKFAIVSPPKYFEGEVPPL